MSDSEIVTDWQCLKNASEGDRDTQTRARREIAERYYEEVVKFVSRQTADPELAREVASDFFRGRVLDPDRGSWLRSVLPYQGRRRFRSLLMTCLKHWILPETIRRRRNRRERPLYETGAAFDIPDRDSPTDRSEELAAVAAAVERLEKRDAVGAEAFRLRHFEGLKFREVADRMGLSTAQAAARAGRFVKSVRRLIDDCFC